MSTVTTVITEPAAGARGAARAVYIAFIGSGFTMASWATRIPQVRDELGLNPSRLGLVLLAIAAGSIVSLVLAGQIVARFGSRGTVTAMAGLLLVALSAVGIGYPYGVAPVVVGLFFFGFANGAWDVAMNVQGAVVERHLGKAIMPRFHAGYSVGTVAGALAGAAAVALHLPVTAHLVGSAILVGVIVMLAVRNFGADDTQPQAEQDGGGGGGLRRTLATWREPRTLLIGAFVLAFAFAEGAGIDWISIAVIDGYGAPATVGTLAFATFLTAMTVGRWFGPALLDRFGRVIVVRALAVLSLVGLMIFVFGPNTATAFAGALLWGLGASLGFPVGMSAAADDPAKAPARVSVVASIGYCAFLGGPPLIGFLGDHVTVLTALTAVAVLLAVATAVANNLRPLSPETPVLPEPERERELI
ncbi:MFS transporter [Amorphoplanes digitatis]|uniref:MFS family permease n=1 Tax=Actinoplanes digitatis TaxID=1868 RepID=A0A7W7I5X2_9ACTN|nr:MFS transporter [Actinoplanes digitatis]MBB4766904.1 MFS family permease [Actinoplanes digitatis]GID95440.1 MFS transporter [Actinoplanes digitatis]